MTNELTAYRKERFVVKITKKFRRSLDQEVQDRVQLADRP
jgi:hypothetical protein